MILSSITLIVCSLGVLQAQLFYQPEQIHLSIGNNEGDYVLTWVTFSSTGESSVMYGTEFPLYELATGTEDLFVDGGQQKRHIYIHRVTLPGLKPEQRYIYAVGSSFGWSTHYSFNTLRTDVNWSPRLAVYGDMGNKNARSLPYLQIEAGNGNFDMILHVGDFAYNMDTNDAYYGDEFMRQIEPIAAIVPYMTCPGNHEQAYNFSNYRNRFTMPGGDGESQFYSFNLGRAHLIFYSTEFYYYTQYGKEQIKNQYNWLKRDLEMANLPENRALRPWIIVMGHRPMYCSNLWDGEHCLKIDNYARVGIPEDTPTGQVYLYGLEELFYQQGVDLMIWAHEHSFERLWPLYNMTICNGTQSKTNPYINPPGPVHLISGAAGNQEGENPFIPWGQPWSAFRTKDYGYTRMQIVNSTHLTYEQVSIDKDGEVIDQLLYVRNKHGPGLYNCK
jgi:hypothetical protein